MDRSLLSRLYEGSVAHLHYIASHDTSLYYRSARVGYRDYAFPHLAGRLASEGRDGFVSHFALAMRRLIMIVVPIAIGFGFFAVPVISDLSNEGFVARDSQAVEGLIVVFMGVFVGASWCELLARVFIRSAIPHADGGWSPGADGWLGSEVV